MKEYYNIEDTLSRFPDCQYYIIWGSRGSGKSYSAMKYLIDDYFENGHTFVISKRYNLDLKTKVCSTMFTPLADYVRERYNKIIRFWQGKWYCYDVESDGKLADCETIGYAFSLNESDRLKGLQISDNCRNLLFEEFMSMNVSHYLENEVNLLVNNVSTIFRHSTNGKVFLLGNAISKTNPYATALGMKFHRMKKGEIKIVEFNDKKKKQLKTRFLIERTGDVNVYEADNQAGIVYDLFGNQANSMIRDGEFETSKYQHSYLNYTFDECLPVFKQERIDTKSFKVLKKQHLTPFVLQFEDYYFAIYRLKLNSITIFAFREIELEHIKRKKGFAYVLNSSNPIDKLESIKSIGYFRGKQEVEQFLDEMLHAIRQQRVFFTNDNVGEDVLNALRQSDVSL